MQPLGVGNVVDEVIDASASIGNGLEGSRVQLLGLERLHEALGLELRWNYSDRITVTNYGDSARNSFELR